MREVISIHVGQAGVQMGKLNIKQLIARATTMFRKRLLGAVLS